MSEHLTINVNMDAKCVECGRGGATHNGLCLSCINKAIRGKTMRSEEGKTAQRRYRASVKASRP